MSRDIENVSLLDILPVNLLDDENINAAARALDEELQSISKVTKSALILPRLDELPESVIDLLAWQWHVDFYEPIGIDLATKRKLIRESIAWHRMKGTPSAVEKTVSAIFDGGNVTEWYEYEGEPYRFRIDGIRSELRTLDALPEAARAVQACKNVRSWLDGFGFLRELRSRIYTGGAVSLAMKYTVCAPSARGTVYTVNAVRTGAVTSKETSYIIEQPRAVGGTTTRQDYTAGAVYIFKEVTIS